MESILSVTGILYLGIVMAILLYSIIALLRRNRALNGETRRMRKLISAVTEQLREKSALYETCLETHQALKATKVALVDQIQEQRRDFDKNHPGIMEKTEALKEENQALKEAIQKKEQELAQEFRKEKQKLIDKDKALQDEHNEMADRLRTSAEELRKARRREGERPFREWKEWVESLTTRKYQQEVRNWNERELEVKFILPLVKYLGYRATSDFQLQYKVEMRAGTVDVSGKPDWVLWDQSRRPVKARAVIEAKAPNKRLDKQMQEQARSYAVAVHAPVYALTNGQTLQLFRCEITGDTRIVNCDVKRLEEIEIWSTIHEAMGVGPGIHETA